MTADHDSPSAEPASLRAATNELINSLLTRPWGQVSVSVYETGRVVALAPWLTGHQQRLAYLLDAQRPDGGWGPPGAPAGYALVPTLSATEALLTALSDGAGPRPDLARAADRGLRMLFRLLPSLGAASVPDTPAADLITVALIEAINGHLDQFPNLTASTAGPSQQGLSHRPGGGPGGGVDGARLRPPAGLDGGRNAAIRAALAAGVRPPEKLLHALEVADGMARGARAVRPTPLGTVGASPAATAAWLDETTARDPAHAARRFLEDVVDQHGGPVPCGYPVTVFERAWVLTTLARAGLTSNVPGDQMDDLVDSLRTALGPAGTPAGDGLPADADTTSVALHALGLLGEPAPPDPLWLYRTETHTGGTRPTGTDSPGTHRTGAHFCTWPGEDGFSVTTNAHVLEAIGQHAARPGAESRYAETADELTVLLCEHQRADGSWYDRWHASPYYATACCALALHRYGGAAARPVVANAADWLLAAQRADGSWGHWQSTAEETAYAIQILALTHTTPDAPRSEGPRTEAIARGRDYLLRSGHHDAPDHDAPGLWHDKDLYRPTAIVRASVLAALKLAAGTLMANQAGR